MTSPEFFFTSFIKQGSHYILLQENYYKLIKPELYVLLMFTHKNLSKI